MNLTQRREDAKTPEVLCFGCIGQPGHYLRSKARRILWDSADTPWGNGELDGGLLTDDYYGADSSVNGNAVEHHKHGWTAISFWDRSGDSRPGSNTSFLVAAEMTGEELILLAKEQWPEVFGRPGFPTLRLCASAVK